MSETAQENTNPAAAAPPQKSYKTLVIIILVVIIAAGGGGGFYFWSATSAAKEDEKSSKKDNGKRFDSDDLLGEEEDGEAAETEDGPVKETVKDSLRNSLPDDENVKHVIELEPFIINLADQDETRYLRMTVSLGVEEGEEKEPDKLFLTRVKNAMLAVLSVKTSKEILTVKGKNKMRKQLLRAAQAASDEPRVVAIYITDFIVQL